MLDQVRFWKDESFRESLTLEQASKFDANPAGAIEMDDNELETVVSAGGTIGQYGQRHRAVRVAENNSRGHTHRHVPVLVETGNSGPPSERTFVFRPTAGLNSRGHHR